MDKRGRRTTFEIDQAETEPMELNQSCDSDLRLTGSVPGGVDGLNVVSESKPARPDFEELDEDEKEMLSEAKARLANTQGKKAKRKARERMIAESRRIALLQRRRELKQVGINAKIKHKKKFKGETDYNAEIAFQRTPEEGPYDVSKEEKMNIKDKQVFSRKTEQFGTYNQELQKQKKKDKRRRDDMKRLNRTDEANLQIKPDDDGDEVRKRRKLVLSEPGTTEVQKSTDIDTRIEQATKSLNKKSFEKSVLFTKPDAEDQDEELEAETVKVKKEPGVKKIKVKKERGHKKPKAVTLAMKLKKLPKPLNNFEIIADEIPTDLITTGEQQTASDTHSNSGLITDKGEIQKREEANKQELIASLLVTQAKKQGLPIPSLDSVTEFDIPMSESVDDQITVKMIELIRNDHNDTASSYASGKADQFTYEELLLQQRLKKEVERKISDLVSENEAQQKYRELIENELGTATEKIDTNGLIELIKSTSTNSNSIEKELKKVVSPHQSTNDDLKEEVRSKLQELSQLDLDYARYLSLRDDEREVMRLRKITLQDQLDILSETVESAKTQLLYP
ncbi:unnamed protein product [Ambrosiozyma monospora]|uniref:Unnamed protein product n=1 Tax=Ambrosiozyma monospora TaxID=43982 RepID=A0ACB5SYG1_AMBMO|nr:unnamed protein product [Ambrosiozyma monospora]